MISKKPLVSIVIPAYNCERFVAETINSVKNQTLKDWELIIVNDKSSDKTAEVVKKLCSKKIKLINLKENSGAAKARNVGIDAARGRFLCFLDADDLWLPEKLEKQIKFMKERKCAFSYHSYEFADEQCRPNGKKVIAKGSLTYKQALKNNIISTITVMFDLEKIRKDLIKMPDIQYVEDTATWWRILRNNYVAYGIPDLFALYRRTMNTSSSNKIKTQKPLWHLYRKVEGLNPLHSAYCLFWKNSHALLRRI